MSNQIRMPVWNPFQLPMINAMQSNNPPWEEGICYLAHPYTRPDPLSNVHSSIDLTNVLLDAGICVFNPLTHSHYLDKKKSRAPEFWYQLDLEFLAKCSCLILSPGWKESKGCCIERGFAIGRGIPVVEFVNILKWMDEKKFVDDET